MNRAVGFIVAAIAGSACGDSVVPPSGMSHDQLLAKLRALPHVTVDEAPTMQSGFSAYTLHFTQPIDHGDPSAGTFVQEVWLHHRSELASAPMIVNTSGYANDRERRDKLIELTTLLDANQVQIEHRYFGSSRPDPADWSKLTIKQMADDEHEIIQALRTIYEGAFLTTGGSKGGMTAVYHRRWYPDDVEGTVAYVAPLSFGAPDLRYPPFFDDVGPSDCRHAVRALAVEMLANRRDAIETEASVEAQAQSDQVYSRVAMGPAVESAIAGFEWAFWQYFGVDFCTSVPGIHDPDAQVYEFLHRVSPVSECDDRRVDLFAPYVYQMYSQLGYPDFSVPYLAPYLRYAESAYMGELPTAEPSYDASAMIDILDFITGNGRRLLFIYGEWDPWIKGKVILGNAAERDSDVFIAPFGNHASQIRGLAPADHDKAVAMVERWAGRAADSGRRRAGSTPITDDTGPDLLQRPPPMLVHALAARR